MSDEAAPVPGWYDDPQNAAQLRWWNGTEWSGQTRPKGVGAQMQAGMPATPMPGGAAPGSYPMGAGGFPMARPEAPNATTAMVLGIVGIACCGLTAPFALFMGRSAMRSVTQSGGMLEGHGKAQAGFILGIIGSVLFVLQLIYLVIVIAIAVADAGAT